MVLLQLLSNNCDGLNAGSNTNGLQGYLRTGGASGTDVTSNYAYVTIKAIESGMLLGQLTQQDTINQ